jgi:hypothetical protein
MTAIVVERPEIHVVTIGEAGPAGPVGPPGSGSSETFSGQSGEVVDLPICTPVALVSSVLVRATSAGPGLPSGKVFALVSDPTLPALGFGNVVAAGSLTATTGQWNVVTGLSGGLVPGATYYVGATPGTITTSPNLGGVALAIIGFALSSTKMRLALGNYIIL